MTERARVQDTGAEATFLRFREDEGWAGSQPVVGLAPFAAVEALLPPCEMAASFGGWAKYEDAAGNAYLGVWGERRLGRFLALLRRRGLALAVVDTRPDGLQQAWRSIAVPSRKLVRHGRKAARQGGRSHL